jgi:hypothetical protein
MYSCGKRNPLYPLRAASFVSIVLYLIRVLSNCRSANNVFNEETVYKAEVDFFFFFFFTFSKNKNNN